MIIILVHLMHANYNAAASATATWRRLACDIEVVVYITVRVKHVVVNYKCGS